MKTVSPPDRIKPATATALVLGATGFLGRAAVTEFKNRGLHVAGAARSDSTQPFATDIAAHRVDLDGGRELRSLLRALRPTMLLNAAGHDPALADSELRDFYDRTTTKLLEAVEAEWPSCRVLLIGSAAEYGNSADVTGSSETDPLRPLSEYGRAKCGQFDIALRFAARGLRVTTARLFNAIGPGQGQHRFPGAFLDRIHRRERPIRLGNGNHIRDWIDVRDAARALAMLGEVQNPPPAVNVCTGQGHSVEAVARELAGLAKAELEIAPGPISSGVLWHSIGNPTCLFSLGWRPQFSLHQTLADQWRHSLDHAHREA